LLIVDVSERDTALIIRGHVREFSSFLGTLSYTIIKFEYRFFWWKLDKFSLSSSNFFRSFGYSFSFFLILRGFSLILDILLIYLSLSAHELVRVTIRISGHIFIDIRFIIFILLRWLFIIIIIILYSKVYCLTKSYQPQ